MLAMRRARFSMAKYINEMKRYQDCRHLLGRVAIVKERNS